MACLSRPPDSPQLALQKQAIENAKLTYSRLPHGHAELRSALEGKETLAEVIGIAEQKCRSDRKRKSIKFLNQMQKHTAWLQNMSGVVDVAVQTQAGIACPLWAPIKFILKITDDHSKATEQISNLVVSIVECLPRLELYERLQSEGALQVALLNVFADVIDFSVRAYQFFRKSTLRRLTRSLIRSFDQEIGAVIARLERRARAADQTAVATELVAAAEFRRETENKEIQKLKAQCEKWLKPTDVRYIHQSQLQTRLDGTCQWIKSNNIFKKWVGQNGQMIEDRILIISGTHGRGKSVLASSIVGYLEENDHQTLFFSFSSSDSSRQTSENLIRTLLWQLLNKISPKEMVNSIQCLPKDGQPNVSELWEVFISVALPLAGVLFCVIDGVDECIDFKHNIPMKVLQSLRACPSLRMLLLGRPHAIEAPLQGIECGLINITPAMLDEDIEAFVINETSKSDILSESDFRESVQVTLKEKSDGMFLWVKLMIDDLNKSSSKFEVKERLENLPRGLENAYSLVFFRLTQSLDKFELRLAQNILAFITTSYRPLRYEEFRYAYAVLCRPSELVKQPLEEFLLIQPPQNVLDKLGGLVTLTNGFLQLSHSSVQEFLVRPHDQWVGEPDPIMIAFRIDVAKAHRLLSWVCLDYLKSEKEEVESSAPDRSQSVRNLREKNPFLVYATLYTFYHLNRSQPLCSITLGKIDDLLESIQSIVWLENFGHLQFEDLSLHSQIDEFLRFKDHLTEAGLGKKLFALFAHTSEKLMNQNQSSGKVDASIAEQVKVCVDLIEASHFAEDSVEEQDLQTIRSVRKSETANLDLQQTQCIDSNSSSKDPSNIVSRAKDLLSGQPSLSVANQIELYVRLQLSLNKTRTLVDPLRLLLRLILSKVSSIPVYALFAIGEFYQRLEKLEEAIEVYNAASKKVDHLNVPIKSTIYIETGDCYMNLCLYEEALGCFETAYSGREILLGKRHRKTLEALQWMIYLNWCLSRFEKVLVLCETMFLEEASMPELGVEENLNCQRYRMLAYRDVGDRDRAASMESLLKDSLELYRVSHDEKRPEVAGSIGRTHFALRDYSKALEYLQMWFDAPKKASRRNRVSMLHRQSWIARTYVKLRRFDEAEEVYQDLLTRKKGVLGPSHQSVQWTEWALEHLQYETDDSCASSQSAMSSQSSLMSAEPVREWWDTSRIGYCIIRSESIGRELKHSGSESNLLNTENLRAWLRYTEMI